MKQVILFVSALIVSSTVYSQIFTDNFDSYTAGDFLVNSNPEWDTWTGGGGGAEDVQISSAQSSSAPHSIYFKATTAQGGPDDIILRFDQVYNDGIFSIEANFFVVQNNGAYFNLQEDFTVGGSWAIDCQMLDDGTITFSNSGTDYLISTYPTGQWFNLRMEINLTSNEWEVFIDNTSQGVFSNIVSSVGILDIFAVNQVANGGNGLSEFYVDDVIYSHTPINLPQLNAGLFFINPLKGLVGQNANPSIQARNLGQDNITSFDLTYTYAGGTAVTESVTGVLLPPLATYDYNFIAPITLSAGNNILDVTVSNVNAAGQDNDVTDDTKTILIDPVVPGLGKIVVGEEATGTWCGWCPRGAVFMDFMAAKYDGFWAGIAVHNNDPMADSIYDAGIGGFIAGYPSAIVDRGGDIDPSVMEGDFIQQIVKTPKAIITNGATFDATTRELKVSLTYDFQSAISGNWRVACALTEDGVSGTGPSYGQSNSYSGGGSGVMGGYELLPSPVPAAQMVYDHVARKIAPSFSGDATLLPSSITAGDEHTVCFTFTLPTEWDESKMHIIGMLVSPSGTIDNAGYASISSAETNGLAACDAVASLEISKIEEMDFNLYPNPTRDMAYIDISNPNGEQVSLKITDLTGKIVAERTYVIQGDVQLPINTSKFDKGTYIVHLQKGDAVQQKKMIIQ
jgi:hypothetical protein